MLFAKCESAKYSTRARLPHLGKGQKEARLFLTRDPIREGETHCESITGIDGANGGNSSVPASFR